MTKIMIHKKKPYPIENRSSKFYLKINKNSAYFVGVNDKIKINTKICKTIVLFLCNNYNTI